MKHPLVKKSMNIKKDAHINKFITKIRTLIVNHKVMILYLNTKQKVKSDQR
jgi:hypothetical protein